MAKIIMHVEGLDGQVDLLPDRVVIHRKGLWSAFKHGLNAKSEIPLGAISEVAYRPASIQMGQIEFVRSGRSTNERKSANATAVAFNRKKNKEFEALKEKIFELLDQYSRQRQ